MKGKITFPDADQRKKFDLQLDLSFINERELADVFEWHKITKLELKSESWLWEQTGNICIEFEHDGKPSGIAATESDYWVHELKRDGETLVYLMFPDKRIRQLARDAYRRDKLRNRKQDGGDGGRAKSVLIRLKDILK
jgi:hypothetical protein